MLAVKPFVVYFQFENYVCDTAIGSKITSRNFRDVSFLSSVIHVTNLGTHATGKIHSGSFLHVFTVYVAVG